MDFIERIPNSVDGGSGLLELSLLLVFLIVISMRLFARSRDLVRR